MAVAQLGRKDDLICGIVFRARTRFGRPVRGLESRRDRLVRSRDEMVESDVRRYLTV